MNSESKPLAIVSGGSGYIGAAIVSAFALQGWEVAVLSRTGGAPPGAHGIVCDIRSSSSVLEAVQQIVERFGKVRACVHAAASSLERVSILEATDASVLESLSTAYLGAWHLAKAVVPQMEAGGTFMGLTSRAIEPGATAGAMGGYLPAKYALRGFLRALAVDPAARGLRVYALAPDFLPGGLNRDLPNIVREVIAKKSNTNSTSVEELAALVTRIVTEPSAFASGTSITFPSQDISAL